MEGRAPSPKASEASRAEPYRTRYLLRRLERPSFGLLRFWGALGGAFAFGGEMPSLHKLPSTLSLRCVPNILEQVDPQDSRVGRPPVELSSVKTAAGCFH